MSCKHLHAISTDPAMDGHRRNLILLPLLGPQAPPRFWSLSSRTLLSHLILLRVDNVSGFVLAVPQRPESPPAVRTHVSCFFLSKIQVAGKTSDSLQPPRLLQWLWAAWSSRRTALSFEGPMTPMRQFGKSFTCLAGGGGMPRVWRTQATVLRHQGSAGSSEWTEACTSCAICTCPEISIIKMVPVGQAKWLERPNLPLREDYLGSALACEQTRGESKGI